jgi:hypothetical protein
VIRARLKTDTKVLDGLSNYAARFDQRAAEIGERVYESLEAELLDDLKRYPAPPANSKYKRTYRLRNAWRSEIAPSTGGFTIEIVNDAVSARGVEYSKYVVGSLAQDRAQAAKAQAWMHKGRWPLAVDTVDAFYELFLEAYDIGFREDLSSYGSTSSSRRAYTR